MNPISTWTAIAVEQLSTLKPILEKQQQNFHFGLFLTNDSLWLKSCFPSGAYMAFRLAFAPAGELSLSGIKEETSYYKFDLESPCSILKIKLEFIQSDTPTFRYTTTFCAKFDMLIPFWPKDMLPFSEKNTLQEKGKIYLQQAGTRSAAMYFSPGNKNDSSVFYFQHLTALNDFFETTKTSAADVVGGNWPEIGFNLPSAGEPLRKKQTYTISDAFVRLSKVAPKKEITIATTFMDHLASIYLLLPRPEVKYHEWRQIAEEGLTGLANHKGCWTFAGGHPYLNAYLSDYKTPPEVMVQLAVLIPMLEYLEWKGETHQMAAELRDGLPAFYAEEMDTLVRWLPAMEDNLDKSEEQKRERVMDSWYLHHPLMNLTRLAVMGDDMARQLLDKSIAYPTKVAKTFDYQWPVFYRMDTLEILKAETEPGKGGEKDVPGAYAKLMMEVWAYTGETKFLNEAKTASKRLKGLGFDVFYQANNTAFAAVALLRLFKHTGQQQYLDLSYVCLASIFANVQLWDCNYGNGKYFPTFFSVFPLKDAPYTAAYEEQEVYATLHGYLQEAENVDILPAVRLLISEFVRYAITRMPFYFPPMLPRDALSDDVKTGEIDPRLWVPLEDIGDGWKKSGEVGQEVYGACISFGIVPRQYFQAKDEQLTIFVDYPSTVTKQGKGSLSFKLLGDERLCCSMVIFTEGREEVTVQVDGKDGKKQQVKPVSADKKKITYSLAGNDAVLVKW